MENTYTLLITGGIFFLYQISPADPPPPLLSPLTLQSIWGILLFGTFPVDDKFHLLRPIVSSDRRSSKGCVSQPDTTRKHENKTQDCPVWLAKGAGQVNTELEHDDSELRHSLKSLVTSFMSVADINAVQFEAAFTFYALFVAPQPYTMYL